LRIGVRRPLTCAVRRGRAGLIKRRKARGRGARYQFSIGFCDTWSITSTGPLAGSRTYLYRRGSGDGFSRGTPDRVCRRVLAECLPPHKMLRHVFSWLALRIAHNSACRGAECAQCSPLNARIARHGPCRAGLGAAHTCEIICFSLRADRLSEQFRDSLSADAVP